MCQPGGQKAGCDKGCTITNGNQKKKSASPRMIQSKIVFDSGHEGGRQYPGEKIQEENARDKKEEQDF